MENTTFILFWINLGLILILSTQSLMFHFLGDQDRAQEVLNCGIVLLGLNLFVTTFIR